MPTVLVALDGSPFADAVVPVAVGMARQLKARIVLAAVVDSDPWRYATGEYRLMRAVTPLHPLLRAVAIGGEYERDLAEQMAMVVAYLRKPEETLRSSGVRVSHCAPVEFEPPRAICDCAQQYEVDLIAIATHGRGPVPRVLLGSVADKVLRTTDRPVLIYRVEGAGVA
jgi:nucleotide-binding universal stress UspA family protein